jgi:hypothetical protein
MQNLKVQEGLNTFEVEADAGYPPEKIFNYLRSSKNLKYIYLSIIENVNMKEFVLKEKTQDKGIYNIWKIINLKLFTLHLMYLTLNQ